MHVLPTNPLHVAVIGPSRFGIGEPFAGGLEAHTAGLVRLLVGRGHQVTVFAGPRGEPHHLPVDVQPIVSRRFDHEFTGRRDTSDPLSFSRHESVRYAAIADGLRRRADVDVIHNNSLHPAVVDADPGDGSFVHVLHCPPFPQLQMAHARLAVRASHRRVIAVSHALAALWGGVATDVIHNGVDSSVWFDDARSPRAGAVWAGRLVEEKAPHLAIRAAKLVGLPIRLAGPIGDQRYFDRFVASQLDERAVWLGPLPTADLADVMRSSTVGLVSPTWDEPFCLVAAEMLACGVPVAAFDRGGLKEVLAPSVGQLATPGDAVSLADAARRAASIPAERCAQYAQTHLSADAMVGHYERMYRTGNRTREQAAAPDSVTCAPDGVVGPATVGAT